MRTMQAVQFQKLKRVTAKLGHLDQAKENVRGNKRMRLHYFKWVFS